MSADKITATPRTEFGKGAARRIRREDNIPGVIYGHGKDPVHVVLPGHVTMMALRKGGANALLTLDVEGVEVEGNEQLVLVKDVQVDPIRRAIEHVDLIAVVRGEKVIVEVPVHVVGDAIRGTLVVTELLTVQLESEATAVPEFIEVSVAGVDAGTQFLAADLVLPEGNTMLTDATALIVNVTAEAKAEEAPAEEEAAE